MSAMSTLFDKQILYVIAEHIDDYNDFKSFSSVSNSTLYVCKMLKHKKYMEFQSYFEIIGSDKPMSEVYGFYRLPDGYIYPDCLIGINTKTHKHAYYKVPITDRNDCLLAGIFLGGYPLPDEIPFEKLEEFTQQVDSDDHYLGLKSINIPF
jgi:hypothetical protein